ncbi:aminofutalosine synthase MqnE [Prolixibacter sp. NT017]|uniref:aminofutalosine synthase MqnE n=1 Tax=Prolixibacter sp. NT017 TaxID=2652390 RepID=UPI0012851319|nr:aminofutalosine synthase MqnE [Prolixibacter sp. NT017]GET26733.1 aminodeoxyfutalosine synthase [Prolixibacter sp. NT017]
MQNSDVFSLLKTTVSNSRLLDIAGKALNGERITFDEGVTLYQEGEIPFLSMLSNAVRQRINDEYVYFNRNFHIEPTNICESHCSFCSYRRDNGEEGSWEHSLNDIRRKSESYVGKDITEVHIVGAVHPNRDLFYYADLVQTVKSVLPDIHIKGFTAVEVDAMIKKAGLSLEEGLQTLKKAGLDSMPGGGAEIFDEKTRARICPDKTDTAGWLKIHETAHKLGIPSNATMLYGLIETYEHRVDHMNRLRELQDQTHGFNTFIPLKFRHSNNAFSHIAESTTLEDLKNYAVARIFLDNIPHLKAYWPMIGKSVAQLSLAFGVDDLDGTIDDSTKIYSMAGAEEQNPSASTDELVKMIKTAGKVPVERDTLYNIVRRFD